jgi:hypothetical protein
MQTHRQFDACLRLLTFALRHNLMPLGMNDDDLEALGCLVRSGKLVRVERAPLQGYSGIQWDEYVITPPGRHYVEQIAQTC